MTTHNITWRSFDDEGAINRCRFILYLHAGSAFYYSLTHYGGKQGFAFYSAQAYLEIGTLACVSRPLV